MDRSKMGKAARDKGKRRERWLVKQLADVGIEAYRTGQYKAKRGVSPDVACDGERYTFEVKDRKSLSIFPMVKQMLDESEPFDIPIAVWYNPNYREAVAVLDWYDFKRLLGDLSDADRQ